MFINYLNVPLEKFFFSLLENMYPRRLRQANHLRFGVPDQPGQHGETLSLLKIKKITWPWWHVPLVPATRAAEAGESLKLRRRELQ